MQVSYNVGMFYKEDAMSLAFLSFVTLSLFMLHEFLRIKTIKTIKRRCSFLGEEVIFLLKVLL